MTTAYVVVNDAVKKLQHEHDIPLAHLRLTDGKYVIYGKTVLFNGDPDNQDATARLVAVQEDGTQLQLDRADIRLAHPDGLEDLTDPGAQEVSLQATLEIPPEVKSERVEIQASTWNGGAQQTVLHAIKVDDIKYQPVG